MFCCIESQKGQATIEAAIILPVVFFLLSLALEPAILLYNRCIMQSVAAETCRCLVTVENTDQVESFAKRHLQAIPQIDLFHRGELSGWNISLSQDGATNSVTISHELIALPLTQLTAGLIAEPTSNGRIKQEVTASSKIIPSWTENLEQAPEKWIEIWK